MRFSLIASALALTAIPSVASAEEVRSPSEFVCALTGDCAEIPAASRQVGDTRGFSLAKPQVKEAKPAVRAAPDTRSFTLAKPRSAETKPNRPAAPAAKVVKPRREAAAAGTGAAALPRVDLRLDFVTGSTTLSSGDLRDVRNFAAALQSQQLAGRRIRIEGHTDSVGSRESNLTLSRARAQAVAELLVAQGVEASRIEVAGYGYDRPLPGLSARASANRRVEAVLIN